MVKGPKDANAPKRPLSAFFTWSAANRERITKSMPSGYSIGDLGRKLGETWRSMSASAKAPFESDYQAAQEKYQKLLTAYKMTAAYKTFQKVKEQAKVDTVRGTKFKKDDKAPKRPLSGYMLFVNDNRERLVASGLSNTEVLKKMGKLWNELSAGKKKPYDVKQAKLKAKYQQELAKYQKSSSYKKYQAEKEEWQAAKKAKLKILKKKQKDAEKESDSEDDAPKRKPKAAKKKNTPPKSKKKSGGKKTGKKAKKAVKKPKSQKAAVKKAAKAGKAKAKAKKGKKKK